MSIIAKPIFVAYQSSDQDVLAAAAKATVSGDSLQAASSSNPTPPPSGSLSGGTIAGIVVGSAAGGVLIATVLTFVALRFCLGYRRTHNRTPGGEKTESELQHELDSSAKRSSPQQPDSRPGWQLSASELPSATRTPELPLSHASNGVAELGDYRSSKS